MMRTMLGYRRKRAASPRGNGTLAVRAVIVVLTMIAVWSVLPRPASATVIQSWSPGGYDDGFVPNSGWGPCYGTDSYYSATTTSTGQVSGGYQQTEADTNSGCNSNTASRTHGGGFHAGSGYSPSSSGTYYLVADWTYNTVQASAIFDSVSSPCNTYNDASFEVQIFLGVWDQTAGSNLFLYPITLVPFEDSGVYGWCTGGGPGGVVSTFAGTTSQFTSATFSLSSSHTYQFRTNVDFETTAQCNFSSACGLSGGFYSYAVGQFNTQTNYAWTLNWLDLDK